jgi:FkbM family methyltransferase
MKSLFKKLYRWLPLKKQVFILVKKFWRPPMSVFQHLYFNDTITVQAGEGKNFKMVHYGHPLENELFWNGLYNGWEKYSMRIWAELTKNAGVIFDIGANTGLYSLVAKVKNPTADVHAFEPFGAIYNKLLANTKLNGLEINANCLAVSNYTGNAVIYTADKDFAYSVTVNQNLWVKESEAIKLDIETITLKDYIEKNKIDAIDLVKIDVETHEPEVMQGFADYFLRFKPLLLIEILNDEIAEQLNPYFDEALFDFYNIDERTGIQKVSRLSKSDYYNFLVVPKEKAHLYNEKNLIYS